MIYSSKYVFRNTLYSFEALLYPIFFPSFLCSAGGVRTLNLHKSWYGGIRKLHFDSKGAIHKGCLHIRGRGGEGRGSGKSGQTWTGGMGVVSQMWTSAWKKNYSYHICEICSDKWNLFFFQIMILEHLHFRLANHACV